MLLNIVTDEELFTSQIVKIILLCIVGVSIIYNLYQIIRSESRKKKIVNVIICFILFLVIVFVYKEHRNEEALLKNSIYVQGITLGYCSVFARGAGIEFQYEVNGQKFINCNTFHPISKDSIVVPGGKYRVRYSEKFPESGRMNFRMKVE